MSEEQRITSNKPEKDPRKVAAGKRLAECNRKAKKEKESMEMFDEPTRLERPESNCENDDEGTNGTTKVLMLVGVAGLAYYLCTKNDDKKEEVVKRESNVVQNNNDVQENTVNRLRSFKN